ncbi:hypothetical protein [Alicyclobacillus macrosporangiidus]|uniref:Uncharacterized protein n=1 Tax=Alicyclobacillus macrosporangiidus TaxID=392015 RepID=A0A1I7LHA1_9BACL|nr:hypothetical protein [Alicyclobacillus macrosporangiidus]SFV09043.1 hypothetical protein SAMN05421543_1506 [Alicyclobacillus macrosporangiidus]
MAPYEAELRTYCYMVQRGKPAASMALQTRYVEHATGIAAGEYGLSTCAEHLDEGWVTFWVCKYIHILEVIKALPQAPKTVFDHWVLGKLYS